MLASGLVTCSMLMAFIDPQAGLLNTFGASIEGSIAQIVERNLGALIGMVGGMLICAAFLQHLRRFVLVVASISKWTFIGLVLIYCQSFMDKAIVAVLFDSLVVLLYVLYLVSFNESDTQA